MTDLFPSELTVNSRSVNVQKTKPVGAKCRLQTGCKMKTLSVKCRLGKMQTEFPQFYPAIRSQIYPASANPAIVSILSAKKKGIQKPNSTWTLPYYACSFLKNTRSLHEVQRKDENGRFTGLFITFIWYAITFLISSDI